jgi:uncharacterized membrane protein YoaK (UPF0700 family)
MSHKIQTWQTVILALGVAIAIAWVLFYSIYYWIIKRALTLVKMKRFWLVGFAILAISSAIVVPDIPAKMAALVIGFAFGLLMGHIQTTKFLKDDRRPIASGGNIFEKAIIFFWY